MSLALSPIHESSIVSVADEYSSALRQQLSKIAGRPVLPVSEAQGPQRIHIGPNIPELSDRETLIWMHSTNAGVDSIVADRHLPLEALLTRTVGQMGRRIGEFVLAWMLAQYQDIDGYLTQTRNRVWERRPVRMLRGDRAVVYGAGEMGRSVAGLLAAAGVHVIGVATSPRSVHDMDQVVDLKGATAHLTDAHWVVSTLPLTPRTRGYFSKEVFKHCRNAGFINAGRGATVVLPDLRLALDDGRLRCAVLDAFTKEPVPDDDEVWSFKNTFITSHTAGVTSEQDIVDDFAECWRAVNAGERPRLQIDRDRGY